MKITADTNVLLRAVMGDDERQTPIAQALLRGATEVALPAQALCEFVWVLGRGYRQKPAAIALALRVLLDASNVVVDKAAVDAGLAILDSGGDFADGIIAYEGARLGAAKFATFDRAAATLANSQGFPALLLDD